MAPPAVAAVALFALGLPIAGAIAAVLAILLLLFFRDPGSANAGGDDVVLAPAWGKVLRIEDTHDLAVSPQPVRRIVTFLSVFDVHLQRAPIGGRVIHSQSTAGKRVAAFRHDAGDVNAGHLTVIESSAGDRVGVRQIVGLLARRIVCYLEPGQRVERNATLGLIKFGSRVDLMVPGHYEILIQPGARLRGGTTPVARARAVSEARRA